MPLGGPGAFFVLISGFTALYQVDPSISEQHMHRGIVTALLKCDNPRRYLNVDVCYLSQNNSQTKRSLLQLINLRSARKGNTLVFSKVAMVLKLRPLAFFR